MKRLIKLFLIISISLIMTGCTEDPDTGEIEYDLSTLDGCIDAMVAEDSNLACEATTKDQLIEEYASEFMLEHQGPDTVYNHSDLTYSHLDKDGSMSKIDFWFQFALLPENVYQTNYETYKGIVETMSLELEAINSEPKYVFTVEFFHYGDVNYKFHHLEDGTIRGEIHVYDLINKNFTDLFNDKISFLLLHASDTDLIEQKITLVTGDHNVEVIVDILNSTYSYSIYYTQDMPTISISEVETLIENAFGSNFTLTE